MDKIYRTPKTSFIYSSFRSARVTKISIRGGFKQKIGFPSLICMRNLGNLGKERWCTVNANDISNNNNLIKAME